MALANALWATLASSLALARLALGMPLPLPLDPPPAQWAYLPLFFKFRPSAPCSPCFFVPFARGMLRSLRSRGGAHSWKATGSGRRLQLPCSKPRRLLDAANFEVIHPEVGIVFV